MASAKKEKGHLVVTAVFAYAHAKSGEVVQLRMGDVVDPTQYQEHSIDHLVSIGFLSDAD